MKKANKFISAMLTISLAFGALILPARGRSGELRYISLVKSSGKDVEKQKGKRLDNMRVSLRHKS